MRSTSVVRVQRVRAAVSQGAGRAGHARAAALLAALGLLASACKGGDGAPSGGPAGSATTSSVTTPQIVSLNGAGSSFVQPLYSKWIRAYEGHGVKINYQSVGSGAGVRAITDKTVDFGASDAPMTDDQLAKASGKILHVPTTLGAVVVTYNVPGAPDHLKLTPEVLSAIFLGDVKTWSDPKIASLNPEAKLPAAPIGVVYRADGSGTTAVFTDYLSHANEGWKQKVGAGTTVKWPVGTGANKNDGVANQVKQTPGAIGYVELAFALETKQPVASLKNRAGKFVDPTLDSINAAAAGGVARMPEDLRVSIVDAEGDGAYPVAAFSYVLVYQDMQDATKGAALATFLSYCLHEGQALGPTLHYAPLPAEVVKKADAELAKLTSGGKPLLAPRDPAANGK